MVEVIGLGKDYLGGGTVRRPRVLRALDDVTVSIPRGETLGLVGESGSGKSTLARLMLRLEEPTRGRVLFQGEDLATVERGRMRQLRRQVQIVFQDPYGSLDPRMSAGDIVAEPLLNFDQPAGARGRRVAEALVLCGLSPTLADRYPHEFSGGQRQRIAIARAIALNPALLVLDEPVSALDVSIQAQILNLLIDLRAELSLTYLFVSHDLSVIRHLSDRVAVMYFGSIVEIGSVDSVFRAALHPYTRALLSAAPLVDPDAESRRRPVVLRGEIPSPLNPPTGCSFHTRCPIAEMPLCAVERPELAARRPGYAVACHLVGPAVLGTATLAGDRRPARTTEPTGH